MKGILWAIVGKDENDRDFVVGAEIPGMGLMPMVSFNKRMIEEGFSLLSDYQKTENKARMKRFIELEGI